MAASQRQFCGKCGTAIADPADLFCTVCGSPFNAAPADELIPEEPTQETVDEVNPESIEENTERELTIEEAQSVTLLSRIVDYESQYKLRLVLPTFSQDFEFIDSTGIKKIEKNYKLTKTGRVADSLLKEGALYRYTSNEDWDWWSTTLHKSGKKRTREQSELEWTKAYPPEENIDPQLKTVSEVPAKPTVAKPKQTVISKPKQTVTQQPAQTSDLTINKLLLFSGTVSIGLYWGNIMLIAFLDVILLIGAAYFLPTGDTAGLIWMVGTLLFTWPLLSIMTCRLRDAGKSPWLCLLALIPLVGLIIIGMLPQSESNEA